MQLRLPQPTSFKNISESDMYQRHFFHQTIECQFHSDEVELGKICFHHLIRQIMLYPMTYEI